MFTPNSIKTLLQLRHQTQGYSSSSEEGKEEEEQATQEEPISIGPIEVDVQKKMNQTAGFFFSPKNKKDMQLASGAKKKKRPSSSERNKD